MYVSIGIPVKIHQRMSSFVGSNKNEKLVQNIFK